MDARQRIGMRRIVQVTIEQIARGTLQPDMAARALYRVGVPFNVIGRVTTISSGGAETREATQALPPRKVA